MGKVNFYKNLVFELKKHTSIKAIRFGGLPSDKRDSLAVIDVPSSVGKAKLDGKRDLEFQFQLSCKSVEPLDGLDELEAIADGIDMAILDGGYYISQYTAPSFGYKDDNGLYVYVCMYKVKKVKED